MGSEPPPFVSPAGTSKSSNSSSSSNDSSQCRSSTPHSVPQDQRSVPTDTTEVAASNNNGLDLGIGVEHFAFPCVHSGYQGILYGGSEAVAFQGTLFFLERKFLLDWQDVLHVQKAEQLGVITVVTRDDVVYKFAHVQHPERVWSQLLSLHNSALLDKMKKASCKSMPTAEAEIASPRASSSSKGSSSVRMSLRRMNSDPLQLSRANLMADGSEESSKQLTPSEVFSQNAKATKVSQSSITTKPLDKYSRSVSAPTQDASLRDTSNSSLQDSWAQFCDQTESTYPDVAIKDHELECNLDTFFNLFLADDAKYSIPNFMTRNGDTDMESSPWKPADDGNSHCRTVEYSHPVNAPLAPPRARARKEQCYRKFGPHGLSLVTDTYVEDVPMTDCFYVHDRIRVQPKGPSSVSLHFEFDIRFIKSTMFKAIIARTTRSEFKKFGQNMAEFMSQALAEPSSELTAETTTVVTTSASTETFTDAVGTTATAAAGASSVTPSQLLPALSTVPNWTLVLVFVVLVLHVRLMVEMRQMKRSVMEMEVAVLALNNHLSTCAIPTPTSPSLQ